MLAAKAARLTLQQEQLSKPVLEDSQLRETTPSTDASEDSKPFYKNPYIIGAAIGLVAARVSSSFR